MSSSSSIWRAPERPPSGRFSSLTPFSTFLKRTIAAHTKSATAAQRVLLQPSQQICTGLCRRSASAVTAVATSLLALSPFLSFCYLVVVVVVVDCDQQYIRSLALSVTEYHQQTQAQQLNQLQSPKASFSRSPFVN